MRLYSQFFSLALFLLLASSNLALGATFEAHAAIVKVESGLQPPTLQGKRSVSRRIASDIFLIRWKDQDYDMSPEVDTLQTIDQISQSDGVLYAHPDWELSLSGFDNYSGPPQIEPDDSLFSYQWNLALDHGWDVVRTYWTVGSPSVTIGIIDTGKTDHPDLIDKWHPFLKYNAVTQSYDAYDNGDWAHGTAVASVAAAETYNGGGIVGACPLCSLVPIKVSNDANDGQILLSSVIDAVNWSTLNELDIVNLSFEGFKPCSHPDVSALKEVLTDAISEGVIVVAAAGNFSTDASSTYPASCPGVVTVAALDQTASLSLYSNYGSVVDIAAPAGGGTITVPPFSGLGEGIVCPPDPDSFFSPYQLGAISAWRTSPATGGAYCYRYLSGTSMAAPYVSGIIGLMRSVSPQINPSVVLEIVQDSAYDVIEVNCPQDCGAGLISVEHAVYLAELHEYGLY